MTKIQNFKMYINGLWVNSESGKTIETVNPENNEVWATVPEANEKDVDKAVKAAQNAFEKSWSNLHPRERAKYLRSLADQLRQNAEHLGTIETIDTGKIFRETKTQANYIAEYYDYFAGLADKVEGTVVPIDKPDMQVTTTRIPIGVVAAIIPWNSQMLLTAVKLAPALAMGNTVVIKASELAPVTLLEFAKLVEKSGIPKGVVNIITGLGEPCGKALTTHDLVERIAFTGGPETAKHIVKNSAENLSQVSLELGGKSPVVVFDDAEQENALNGITAGIFGASGQSCIAGSRLYIQSKIYDDFLNKLIAKAEKIKLGYWFWIILLGIGTYIILRYFRDNMGLMVKIATILSFLTAPFYAILNFILISGKHTPKKHQPSLYLKILSVCGIIFLIVFSAWFLLNF